MTYHYRGKDIGNRAAAVKYILALPTRKLEDFVYTYLDQFEKGQLEDLIWASVYNGDKGWTMRDLIEDALLMMEDDWGSYPEGYLEKGETVSLGDFEYDDWVTEEER